MFFNNGTGTQAGVSCTTPACVKMAGQILTGLADNYTKIDPCVSFDQLACNGWDTRTVIPTGENSVDPLGLVGISNHQVLRDILEGSYPSGRNAGWITTSLTPNQAVADEQNFKKMQEAYFACMNSTDKVGLRPLVELAARVATIYPVETASNWTRSEARTNRGVYMGRAISFFESYGIQTFTTLATEVGGNNTVSPVFPGGLNSMSSAGSPEEKQQYIDIGAELLQAIYPRNITRQRATDLMTKVRDLEQNLLVTFGEAMLDPTGLIIDLDAPAPEVPVTDLAKDAPELNISYALKTLAPPGTSYDKVLVNIPAFYPTMSKIISNTSSEVIQAFFIWKATVTLAPFITSDITDRFNGLLYTGSTLDPAVNIPRYKQCIDHIDTGVWWMNVANPAPNGLSWILARFFIEKAYSQHAREFTDSILASIQQEFISRLYKKQWVSDQVKKASEDKVKKILRKVGYPDVSPNVTDPVAMSTYYAEANITDSYLWNALAMAKSSVAHTWARLGQPADRNLWQGTVDTVNAYYNAPQNEIVVFAGIQQFPVYQDDFPAYLSYGGMGSLCGHELTHGFDTTGRLFDGSGNFSNWWDNTTIEAFENRTTCFVDQYSNFTIPGTNGTVINVSGSQTLAENIADSGGVEVSYRAWQKVQAAQTTPDLGLPGLSHFSNEQLFFIQWAQTWCGVDAPGFLADQVFSDVHAPGFARILGPLANSRGFREAYNCPVKEPTCELW